MTVNLSKSFLIALLANVVIASAFYHIANTQFKAVDRQQLQSQINLEKHKFATLKSQYSAVQDNETIGKFDLENQSKLLKNIIANFKDSTIRHLDANNKGYAFGITGGIETVLLLAYQINQFITNNRIKAKVSDILINGGQGSIKVQIYGVNNDN